MTGALAPSVAIRPLVLLAIAFADERDMYREYFEWAGYRVAVAGTAEDALRVVAEQQPTVAVVEHWLPGDGARVCSELKAHQATSHVKVVLIANPPVQVRVGCDALLFKPLLPDELERRVEQMLAPRAE